ncbi:transport and Golgi organization protein 1 homolog isoform X1 [Ictidomys tridecemlineatus]
MTRFTCIGRKAPAVEEGKVHSQYPPPALGPTEVGNGERGSCAVLHGSVASAQLSLHHGLSTCHCAFCHCFPGGPGAPGTPLFTTLPDDTQPGPDFYGLPWKPVVFTVFFGIVSFVIFFWRTVLVVKDRVYQVNEQQISKKVNNFIKENEELMQKLSNYEQKVKESKKQVQETMKQKMILSDETTKYKDKMKLLEKANELLDERAKSLHVMLESEKEQKAKNQDLIMENKKTIEKLKDVISVNTSELSEVKLPTLANGY